MRKRGNMVINLNDVWENNKRYATHVHVINIIEKAGFEFRNTIMWDKPNLIKKAGIFWWPSNYIILGTTMELTLDFLRRN
jgi:DNA modification methylase